jgi:tRNA (guanine37-N1)-methyltransferase
MKRAIDKGLVVHFHNLRDYTTNRQKVLTITLMAGAGMVMTVQPLMPV